MEHAGAFHTGSEASPQRVNKKGIIFLFLSPLLPLPSTPLHLFFFHLPPFLHSRSSCFSSSSSPPPFSSLAFPLSPFPRNPTHHFPLLFFSISTLFFFFFAHDSASSAGVPHFGKFRTRTTYLLIRIRVEKIEVKKNLCRSYEMPSSNFFCNRACNSMHTHTHTHTHKHTHFSKK